MKKVMLYILIILLILVGVVYMVSLSNPLRRSNNEYEILNTHTIEPDNFTPSEIVINANGCVYVNEKCGYQITFPKNWEGWFNVYVSEKSFPEVWFEGKSPYYSLGDKIKNYPHGSPMFKIVDQESLESHPLDSPQLLGNINGINFYVAFGTSSPWDFPSYPNHYILDKDEKLLLETLLHKKELSEEDVVLLDKLKVRDMFTNLEQIFETFQETNIRKQ